MRKGTYSIVELLLSYLYLPFLELTKRSNMAILRRISFATLLVAFVTLFSVPTDAQAQEQTPGQVNAGNLISALNNISANIQDVQALNDLTAQDVQVVNVQDVLNDNKVQAFNNALNRNDISALTEFLNNSNILNEALNQNNVAVSDVVAVSVLSGGDVVLYYQPSDG